MTDQIISVLGLQERKKKNTDIYLVTNDGEVTETTSGENIPWIESMDVYPDTHNNSTTYNSRYFLYIHNVQINKESPGIHKGRNVSNQLDG